MRIEKTFAPITLVIETEEDKKFMLEVLSRACKHYMNNGLFFGSRKNTESFPQKCFFLEGKIK